MKNKKQSTSTESKSTEGKTPAPKFSQDRYDQVMKALGRINRLVLPKELDTDNYYYRYVSLRDPIRVENLESIGYEKVTKPDGSFYTEFASVNDEKRTTGRIDYILMRITWENKEEIEKFKMINRGIRQAGILDAESIEELYYTAEKQGDRKGEDLRENFDKKYNPNNYKFF